MVLPISKYSSNFNYQFETINYLVTQKPTAMTSLYKYLLFVFLAMNSIALHAQSEVTLNIKLHPIQTLVVNQAKVDINYTTKEDYNNGVTIEEPEHITVYSTGGFTVQVKASSANLVNADASSTETISASDIQVSAQESQASIPGLTLNAVSLDTSPKDLIVSPSGAVDKSFDISYAAKGDLNSYVNKYFSPNEVAVYSTDVVYEIVAR